MNVFISHAEADREIVAPLVTLLETGCNVHDDDLFCSSIEGLSIPPGEPNVSYILSRLRKANTIICVLSSSYFQSEFCLAEAGAAQLRFRAPGKPDERPTFISLIVPPSDYSCLNGVLEGSQGGKITDRPKLDTMRDVLEKAGFKKATARWNEARDIFLKAVHHRIEARQLKELLQQKLMITKVIPERASSEAIKKWNIKLPTKFRIVFRNTLAFPLSLTRVSWDEGKAGQRWEGGGWYVVQNEVGDGKWGKEERQLTVSAGKQFRVSVAFDSKLSAADLELLYNNDQLGKLELTTKLNDHVLTYTTRF